MFILLSYYKFVLLLLVDFLNFEIVLFDIFDIVLCCKYYELDYVKYLLG